MVRKKNILIIDDEPENIEVIFDSLKDQDYTLYVALDGKSGYEVALDHKPDLVITDWEMPGLSGIETIKLFKAHKKLSTIPIIMATGKMIRSHDLGLALDTGADDYIRKPIDQVELLARIRSMILLYETMKQNIVLQHEIHQQKEAALQKEIEDNKKQLAYFTLRIVQQSEVNNEMLKKIAEAEIHSNNTGKEMLQSVSSTCKHTHAQSYWSEFEQTFTQVHTDFYKKLTCQHQSLTKNELKLAAFCKLNMTPKEVASVTFQSELSIKKARHRLRKKLELSPKIKLNTFFQRF